MYNEIIINVHPFETRVAILEDNKLVELIVEKKENQNVVGNIYKGIVRDILPGMGAAFIDLGITRTAFLHYSDIDTDFLDIDEEDIPKIKKIRNDSSKIGKLIKEGQEILVQVQKGPIGKKGARLTGQISIPGKFLVYFPNNNKIAISRKIQNSQQKAKIKSILKKIKKDDVGLIVRTDAIKMSEDEFKQEYKGLEKTWELIEKQKLYAKAPVCVFDGNDLSSTLIRDLFSSKVDRLVVDNMSFRNSLLHQLNLATPELGDKIELYQEDSSIFDAYGIEKEIQTIFNSRVKLPNGGNIVIEQTEALVSVDINTGSFTGKSHYDETIKRTNIEAAAEIARQIRLRDLSGIVVIDFIDMKLDSARAEVLSTLKKNLKNDRAKNKVYPFGPLGLVMLTRKRTRTNLLLGYSEHCPCCKGTGRVISRDSVAMKLYRWLSRAAYFIENIPLRIVVHPNVNKFLESNPNYFSKIPNKIEIVPDDKIAPGNYKIFDLKNKKEITAKFNA